MRRRLYFVSFSLALLIATVNAHAAEPAWDVEVVSSTPGELTIDLRLVGMNVMACFGYVCTSQVVYYSVTPCPIAGPPCLGSTTEFGQIGAINAARIVLEPGVDYTFSGRFEALGLSLDAGLACNIVRCTDVQTPADLIYSTPLPVSSSTWGKIKALYRSP